MNKEKTAREYSSAEVLFAWLSLLAGYFFCRTTPVEDTPLGALIYAVALFALTAVMFRKSGQRPGALALTGLAAALVLSCSFILSGNGFIYAVAHLASVVLYFYFVYAATGNAIKPGVSGFIAADFLKAVLVAPFKSFDKALRAIASGRSGAGGTLLKIAIGVCIAVIPTAFAVLELSYDSDFTALLHRIFDFDFDVVSQITSIFFAFPVGMLIFGAFISGLDHSAADEFTYESCTNAVKRLRIAPIATVCTAVIPLLTVYIIFFVSQWKYYVSGFVGVLPTRYSYAQYAREGFFQLCIVSVVNLAVILGVGAFTKRKGRAARGIRRVIAAVLSACTLVLISTAMAKMLMYIDCYGLTHKRVYASWFMLLLALVFLLVIVKQLAPRFRLIPVTMALCLAMFALLALSDVDTKIADYNVDRYLSGKASSVDVDAFGDLGDSAIPALCRLAQGMDERKGTDITEFLPQDAKPFDPYSKLAATLYTYDPGYGFFEFTIPKARAARALENLGIEPWSQSQRIAASSRMMQYMN